MHALANHPTSEFKIRDREVNKARMLTMGGQLHEGRSSFWQCQFLCPISPIAHLPEQGILCQKSGDRKDVIENGTEQNKTQNTLLPTQWTTDLHSDHSKPDQRPSSNAGTCATQGGSQVL
jgi:hypothetical protein